MGTGDGRDGAGLMRTNEKRRKIMRRATIERCAIKNRVVEVKKFV
jgi:hypothetical protein